MKFTEVSTRATTIRTLIFTLGHYCIDVSVVLALTDAPLSEALQVGFLAPMLNALWYWVLDRAWTHLHRVREDIPRERALAERPVRKRSA